MAPVLENLTLDVGPGGNYLFDVCSQDSRFFLPLHISGAHVLKSFCNFRIDFWGVGGELHQGIPAIIGVII